MHEKQASSLGWKDTLEKEMATHSSILAWVISQTEEPGGLQSMVLRRVGLDLSTKQQQQQKYAWPNISKGHFVTLLMALLCSLLQGNPLPS